MTTPLLSSETAAGRTNLNKKYPGPRSHIGEIEDIRARRVEENTAALGVEFVARVFKALECWFAPIGVSGHVDDIVPTDVLRPGGVTCLHSIVGGDRIVCRLSRQPGRKKCREKKCAENAAYSLKKGYFRMIQDLGWDEWGTPEKESRGGDGTEPGRGRWPPPWTLSEGMILCVLSLRMVIGRWININKLSGGVP